MSLKTDNFIKQHKDEVISATRGTGLYPSVKMAQMIIESSWGEGTAVKKANNFFGIKADKNYSGNKIALNTPKDASKVNYFRVYKSPLDSIKDHTKFLIENPRYSKYGVFKAKSPEEQIKSIADAGYAEAKNYVPALTKLISAYNLKSLDKEANMTESKPKNDDKIQAKEVVEKSHYKIAALTIAIALTAYVGYKLTTKNK